MTVGSLGFPGPTKCWGAEGGRCSTGAQQVWVQPDGGGRGVGEDKGGEELPQEGCSCALGRGSRVRRAPSGGASQGA